MKRRVFIERLGLTGLGVSLLGTSGMTHALNNEEKWIHAKVDGHVRHGNLYKSNNPPITNSWIKHFTCDRLYENGISSSARDLFHVNIETFSDKTHLTIGEQTVWWKGKEIGRSNKNEEIALKNSNWNIHLFFLRDGDKRRIKFDQKQAFVASLSGRVKTDRKTFARNEALLLKNKRNVVFEAQDQTILLVCKR